MSRPPFTALRSCFLYEGLVRQMIRDAKYRRTARYLRYFSGEMYLLARSEFPSRIGAVAPVPLHRARLWDRTYNQSELMARHLSAWWGRPLWNGLRRIRSTRAQSGLSGRARRRNLQQAFAVVTARVPRTVLLVDDVVTTGATLEACARALRSAGVRRIYAITIARAVKINR
jgi:ComF family protein